MKTAPVYTSAECESDEPVTLDGTSLAILPIPSRIDLKTIDQVRVEMARIYRDMRSGRIDSQDGTRMAYVLAQIGKLIESGDIEERVKALHRAIENRR